MYMTTETAYHFMCSKGTQNLSPLQTSSLNERPIKRPAQSETSKM